MVSSTKQTMRRRAINTARNGRSQKRARARTGTPAFPIHTPSHDANAPDAKKKTG
ncbi:MAG: hypothetical protein U0263_12905 [Polyangiaceae bacterium]